MKSIYVTIALFIVMLIGCNGRQKISQPTTSTDNIDTVATVDSQAVLQPAENLYKPRVVEHRPTCTDSIFGECKYFVRPYRITSSLDTVGDLKAVRIITYAVPEDTIIYGYEYTTYDTYVAIFEQNLETGVIDTTFINRHKMLKWLGVNSMDNSDTIYDRRYYNQNDVTIFEIEKPKKYKFLSNDTISVKIGIVIPDTDRDNYIIYRRWNGGDEVRELRWYDNEDGLGGFEEI